MVSLPGCLSEGEAFAACRHAILGGASFWIDAQALPASELVSTYAMRERHTRWRGIPTLGFTDAVIALRACEDQPVRPGSVDTQDLLYHVQRFINNDNTAVIACLAVDLSWNPRNLLKLGNGGVAIDDCSDHP